MGDNNLAISSQVEKESLALTINSESGQLLKMAIEKNLDVEKLKALMDLRDREDRRKAERDFENHFAEMQRDYIPAFKSKDVKTGSGQVAYSYCPLPVILSVYAPILARHGFSYRWEEEEIESKSEKRTTCFLSGYGFTRQASISLPYGSTNQLINPIQARGATSEYGRRYTFMNVTGCIVADEMDTDGVIETKPSNGKPEVKQPQAKKSEDKPKNVQAPEAGNFDPFKLKLKKETVAQILEMVTEMKLAPTLTKAKFTYWDSLGDAAALKACSLEYRNFLAAKR